MLCFIGQRVPSDYNLEKWYRKYLPEVPIHPVSGWLYGVLSDSSYPYIGYVVVDIEFQEKAIGGAEVFQFWH